MKNKQLFISILSIIVISSLVLIYKFNSFISSNDSSLNDITPQLINTNKAKFSHKIALNNLYEAIKQLPKNINHNLTSALSKPSSLAINNTTLKINSSSNITGATYNLIGGTRPTSNENNTTSNHNLNGLMTSNINESNSYSNSTSLNIMYISEFSKNQITACQIVNGNLVNCTAALSGLNQPEGLFIIKNMLYILGIDNKLTVCKLNHTGIILDCNNNNDTAVDSPGYVAYSNESLYISNFAFNMFSSCSLDDEGNIGKCQPSIVTNLSIFTNKEYNGYTYSLTNESALHETGISKCSNNTTSSCQLESSNLIVNVYDFTFNSSYIYIVNDNGATNLVRCNLDSSGDLTSCKTINNSLAMPTGMVQYTTN